LSESETQTSETRSFSEFQNQLTIIDVIF